MAYLIYANESSVTGRAVAGALGIRSGHNGPDRQEDYVIRWGSTRPLPRRPRHPAINPLPAVRRASDKLVALDLLRREGIAVPRMFNATEAVRAPKPLLGRAVRHTGGTDVVLVMQNADIPIALQNGCEYFTEYIPKTAEYRIHVVGGEVIKTSQKVRTNDGVDDVHHIAGTWVWNHAAGYTFRNPQRRCGRRNKQLAIDAVAALGLTFGAVDLIVGDDDRAYILEVNTAPGLIESGLTRYVTAFRRLMGMPEAAVVVPEGFTDDNSEGEDDS